MLIVITKWPNYKAKGGRVTERDSERESARETKVLAQIKRDTV